MLFSARVMKLPNMCITPIDNDDAGLLSSEHGVQSS